ncbi:MAG TPA: xanthine dehydrogenase family protein subunit M [Candidatus Binatia bacterium]|jgi:CO/xanthine dehydrogenase FAD-binding subunit
MTDRKLIKPQTLEEALAERERYGRDALPIAGGQSLLVLLRNKLIDPTVLIDLEPIGDLRGLDGRGKDFSIGAMTTIDTLASSPEVRQRFSVLGEAAKKVGSTAIRNLGTIGGNVCHNEPGADLPPALLTLNAKVELRSRSGSKKLELSDFFRGYFETAVKADELLVKIEIPQQPAGARGVYLKHAISPEDLAIVSASVVVVPDGQQGKAGAVRIGLGGVAPVPFRARKAEESLAGVTLDDKAIREAAELAATEAEPMTDPHGSAQYRRKMVKVLVRRALTALREDSKRSGNGKA